MSKQLYLRIVIETSWVGASETVMVEIDGTESVNDLEEMAHEEFLNYCSYGFAIVDAAGNEVTE